MIESKGEARVSDQNGPTRRPLEAKRLTTRETEDVRLDVAHHFVRPDAEAFRHELRLAHLLGDEDRDVVPAPEDPVGPLVPHRHLLPAWDRRRRLGEPESEGRK